MIQETERSHLHPHALVELSIVAIEQNDMATAIRLMQQAVQAAPTVALYRRNLGELLRRVRQLDAAIASHNIAVDLQPASAENHFHLGLALNDNQHYERAVSHYRKAILFDAQYGLAWNNLGASLECLGDKSGAKEAYAKAIQLNPTHAEAQNNLGAIYSEQGLLDEARTHFTHAIVANRDFVEAHYNLSSLHTYQKDDLYLHMLESITQKAHQLPLHARIRYYFALGKALDDTGDYTRAFQAYAEGNQLQYAKEPWSDARLKATVEQIKKVFTQSFLKNPPKTEDPRTPIFIVGMPRSGTTLIEQILSSHPAVHGAGELSILDDILQNTRERWCMTDKECVALGQTYLERTWALAPDKQYITDKMPGNCFYIGMIYRMLPGAKIIHAMRDPLDTCFSCYTKLFKQSMPFSYDLDALGRYFLLYAEIMQHWHTVLPKGVIFDLPYEHMIASHENETRKLLEYIGLPWDSNCLSFYKNKRPVHTASVAQVRKPIYRTSVKRWEHFKNALQPLAQTLSAYRSTYPVELSFIDNSDAHALHLRGVSMHQAGKTALGVELIQRALQSDATVALFHSNLGEMYRQLQQIDLSIACGQRAVECDPQSATALSNLGVAYYDAKQYDQAEACHLQALALNPQQSNALNNMGSVYKERKNIPEAIRYYQAAIAASKQYVEPLNNLGAVWVTEQQFSQAIEILNRAIALSPAFVEAYCNLGFAYHGLDRDDMALACFQRALQLKPSYAEAYIGLCKLHRAKMELDAAKQCVEKAIAIEPHKAEFYQCLAEVYGEQGDTQHALFYFDKALAMDPELGDVYLSKGNLLMELGETDEAEKLFSHAAENNSATIQLSAHCSLVQVRTVKAEDTSMQALLSHAANSDHLAITKREQLHFSLGKCYDDLGESSLAFDHFTKGSQLKRSHITYNREDQDQFVQRLIENFTPDVIASLRQSANPSTLPIFVLGMPRSGTTLIEQIIANHPSVYGAGELVHLSVVAHGAVEGPLGMVSYPDNMRYLSFSAGRAIADEYLACLQRYAPKALRITDKMPGNFVDIGLIHALFPQAKIIHVERNPIDTCFSCYTKLFRHGQFFSYDLIELGHYYANYRRIMDHWRQVLPAGSWLDVQYEAFVTDPEPEARRLIAYCDLDWDKSCLAFHTTKRQVRTASVTQVRKPIYTTSVERWRRFERELAPLIRVLGEASCFLFNS